MADGRGHQRREAAVRGRIDRGAGRRGARRRARPRRARTAPRAIQAVRPHPARRRHRDAEGRAGLAAARGRLVSARRRRAPAVEFEALVGGRYGGLSPAHRKVADFLLADGRRAQALGFDGYPELRDRLRERFLTTATSLERFAASPAGSSAGRNGLLARILADDADAILGTLAQVPHETFEAVVEAIATARRTYVVGFRGSAGIALVLGMGLRIYLPETRVIAVNVGDAAEELLSLRRGDLVIVISVLRYAGQTIDILRYAHDAKARTVAITDSPISPVARLADLVLLTKPTTPRTMASYAPVASLASALTEAVAARRGGNAGRSLREAEALWDRFRVHARDER
ncbi:MAG: MurR/RpiR family transcriptional regulator [Chloroflexi bacterium]|nr:MAG: MurR/RpiR family transcriptional regulator [Chloroflexota bacterium]